MIAVLLLLCTGLLAIVLAASALARDADRELLARNNETKG